MAHISSAADNDQDLIVDLQATYPSGQEIELELDDEEDEEFVFEFEPEFDFDVEED